MKNYLQNENRSVSKRNNGLDGSVTFKDYPIHNYYAPLPLPIEKLPVYTTSGGIAKWCQNCCFFRENSTTFALELVIDGEFSFVQNKKRYILHAGDIFLVQKNANSKMTATSRLATKYALLIDGYHLLSILNQTGLDKVDIIHLKDFDLVKKNFEELITLLEESSKVDTPAWKNSALSYQILMILGAEIHNAEYPTELHNALDFMYKNINYQLNIAELSHHCQVSPSTIHRLFKEYINDTPINYFIKLKIDIAINLLCTSNLPIKEISNQLGYSNSLYFSSAFKKLTNKSPNLYRKDHKII